MSNSNSQSQSISTGSSSSNSSTNLLQAAASSTSQITPLTLPNISLKLNRDNYPTWAPFIHHALECFDFEHLVDKDDIEPPKFVAPPSGTESSSQISSAQPIVNPEWIEWKRKDKIVLLWIKSQIFEQALSHVSRAATSRQAWVALENVFKTPSHARLMRLRMQLSSLTQGSLSVVDYVEKKRSVADQLAMSLHVKPEQEMIIYILNGLDPRFSTFATTIRTRNVSETLTVDGLLGLLIQEEQSQEASHKQLLHAAHVASRHQGPASQHQQYKNRPFHGQQQAHTNRGQRKNLYGRQSQQFNRGYNNGASNQGDGQHNHNGNRNFNGGGGQHRNSNSGGNRGGQSKGKGQIVCQICNKVGHPAIECYSRFNHAYTTERASQITAMLASPTPSSEDPARYIDSGASNHLTADLNNLSVHSDYTSEDYVQIGDGKLLRNVHTRTDTLNTNHATFKLKNILHVPHITKNLLSVSKFTRDNRVYLEFHPNLCLVKSMQGKVLLRGSIDRGFYKFPMASCSSTQSPSTESPVVYVGERTTLQGWHNRLGHPHEKVIRHIVSEFSLPISSNKFVSVCGSCQLGKSHRLSLNESHVSSKFPLQLIYSDVWGPASESSINGNRFFVQFLDDHSKFVWVYFMKHKSQVFEIFQSFKTYVERQFGQKIKQIQTDWGGEYRSISTFFSRLGIELRLSCPHTHEQNGAPERRHKDIVAKGLTLLAHAYLPLHFWEFTFTTTVYLINRTISPGLDYKSPFQILYNKIPNYKFLKTFGRLCYPYLRPYNSHKLQFRSLPCIFLGYSGQHKGYLCFHLPTHRTYIVRHVVFDDDTFPYPTKASNSNISSHCSTSDHESYDLSPLSLLQTATHRLTSQCPINPPPSSPLMSPSQSATHKPSPSPLVLEEQAIAPESPDHTAAPRPAATSQPPQLSHLRPANTKTHPMITRAQTNSLRPRAFSSTKHPLHATSPPLT